VLGRLSVGAVLFGIFALAVTGRLRFTISAVTLWLGGISYSLYLSHRNLGNSTLVRLHDLGVPIWLGFLLTLIGALLLGTALTRFVERPAMRVLRHWYRAWQPAGAARA
jgi:peptidoglycan/LPS O-acetylase OafA/YrhL